MNNGTNINQELLAYVHEWADGVEELLKKKVIAWKAEETGDLLKSIKTKVYQKAGTTIGFDLSFLDYGRFVDMGAGKGYHKGQKLNNESYSGATEKYKTRRPKKWFSRPFYGRLNALNSVLASKLVEEVIETIQTANGN